MIYYHDYVSTFTFLPYVLAGEFDPAGAYGTDVSFGAVRVFIVSGASIMGVSFCGWYSDKSCEQ